MLAVADTFALSFFGTFALLLIIRAIVKKLQKKSVCK